MFKSKQNFVYIYFIYVKMTFDIFDPTFSVFYGVMLPFCAET